MESTNQDVPIKNQAASAEFYLRSPFHNTTFILVACIFAMDLLACAALLVECLRHSTFHSAVLTVLAGLLLVGLWFAGLRTHEDIHILFAAGQIKALEKGSALDKVLGATTRIIIGGLFSAFGLAAICLAALGEALLRR